MDESTSAPTGTEPPAMTTNQMWALLRETPVGRVAVVVDGQPEIFPVNHVVDHGSLVFRTGAGTKLAGIGGASVAFEIDGYDVGTGEAWSVVVKGVAREVTNLYEGLDAARLPLMPWQAGNKPRLVRIEPAETTGRRFPAVRYRDNS